jgi:hypothetical protein
MKHSIIKILIGIVFLLPVGQASADPLATSMATPVSVFDLFLFRVQEATKCNSWFSNANLVEADVCLTGLRYNNKKKLLQLYLRELPGSENLQGFFEANALEREAMLLSRLERLVQRLGVVNNWGLLHSLPVNHSLSTSFDIAGFRGAVAAITEVHLNVDYDGKIYNATRYIDGSVESEIR